ncbi:DgyrCDS3686 [Dimorphilus gyrociliatus]|uniref:DgyrCDS3686 n=1 Tax=Dimorphilus gyrociliatus TaxID=2664684 RepID=A0A7I8VGS6_9ANNE|nr:DgyrCDS3686 [Dimorphilus gyrociliatus]
MRSIDIDCFGEKVVMLVKLFVLFCAVFIYEAKVPLKQNKYEGLTVHIRSDIDESDAKNVIDNLKWLLTNSSEALFKATNRRGYIENVNIIIPENWTSISSTKVTNQIPVESIIVTEKPNAQYGHNPYVLNLEECGEPGEYIHFTRKFLVGDKSTFGKPQAFMLHLFGHLLYGLRDEFGNAFDQSEAYYVNAGNKVEAIRCSKSILVETIDSKGKECQVTDKCLKVPENCKLKIKADDSASAMYYPFSGATKFCDDSEDIPENERHNSDAPTPQNYFCDGKSAWEVLRESDDFRNGNNPPIAQQGNINLRPNFHFYRETSDTLNIVLVLDVSGSMDKIPDGGVNPLRQIVYSACIEYITDYVVPGDRIGIVRFNNRHRVLQSLITVTSANKPGILEKVPNYASGGTSIMYGVKGGVETLRDAARGGILILMTDGESDDDDLQRAKEIAYDSGVTVYSIMLTRHATPFLKAIADATGGQTFFTTAQTVSNNEQSVSEVLRSIGNIQEGLRSRKNSNSQKDIATQVAKNVVHILPNQKQTTQFWIDEYSVSFSLIIATLVDPNNIQIELKSPNGDQINIKNFTKIDSIANTIKITVSATEGKWTYTVSSQSGSVETRINVDIISYTNSQSSQISFSGKFKTTSFDFSRNTEAVKIESKLLVGDYAIENAKVVAQVFFTGILVEEIQLNDKGIGADVFANDGIYSGFFSNITGNGRYTARYIAVNYESKAFFSTSEKSDGISDQSDGCSPPSSKITFLKPFERITAGNFLDVVNFTSEVDYFPPSKVKDLKFTGVNWDKDLILFEWTAVGDDWNFGLARKYDFRKSSTSKSLRKSFNSTMVIEGIETFVPKESGEKEKFEMKMIEKCSDNFFVGLTVIDDVGHTSKLSNVISVSYKRPKCGNYGNTINVEVAPLVIILLSYSLLYYNI